MTGYPTRRSGTLSDEHRKALVEGSGIDPGLIAERGYRTARKRSEVPEAFKPYQRRAGLVVPVHSPDGQTESAQLRPDNPRKDRKGKPLKYETPASSRVILDVHPRMREEVRAGDGDLWITEGIKKADALTSRGLAAVGLIGVWNFQREGTPLACWDHVGLDGRRVYVVYDNDVTLKEGVQLALERLVGLLEDRGAAVLVVYLPDGPLKGVDDYLAAGHTVAELRMLAREFEPADVGRIRMSRDERLRAAVGEIRARWWSHDWSRMAGTGDNPNSMRGHTARDVMKALTDAAARHGKAGETGVEVSISTRTLALAAATSRPSASKALRNLEADGFIEVLEAGAVDKARSYRLLTGRATLYHDGGSAGVEGGVLHSHENDDPGGKPLRAPRLRWSSPGRKARKVVLTRRGQVRRSPPPAPRDTIVRLGKRRGAVVDALDAAGGTLALRDLCEVLRCARPRDLRRRILPMLEDAGILTVEDDTVRLAGEWLARLEEARLLGGEIQREDLERKNHRRQREAFRRRNENPPDQHYANVGADGHIEDLRPVAEPEPETPPAEIPVSPLAAALRDYLDRSPSDADQPAGWLGSTLWALELFDGKPTPAETRAAIDELGGDRFLRDYLEKSREGAA